MCSECFLAHKPVWVDAFFGTRLFYSDEEAERVAEDFFKYHYVDRGKMKWQGFILSEQTAALKKDKHQSREVELGGLHYVKTKYDQA